MIFFIPGYLTFDNILIYLFILIYKHLHLFSFSFLIVILNLISKKKKLTILSEFHRLHSIIDINSLFILS